MHTPTKLKILNQITVSWYLFLSILLLAAFISGGLPRLSAWKAARDRKKQAKRFEKTLSEVEKEDAAVGSAKKKRRQVGETTGGSTSALKGIASAKTTSLPSLPSTPTPTPSKKIANGRPRAPSQLGTAPIASRQPSFSAGSSSPQVQAPPPEIDTSDFEPVKPKHKLKATRRVSNATSSSTDPSTRLQVPERSGGESSAGSTTGSDDEKKVLAETKTIIANLRVEIGVAKAEEGKARNEAEKAREMERELSERMEKMAIERESSNREVARRETELQSRLHALSNQYQTLFQRHAALETAFHNLASSAHPNGTPLPSPHLHQGSIPVYPIAIPMPSPVPLRHSSGSYYGYPSPMANGNYPPSPNAAQFFHPPPQFRRTSGVQLGSPNPYSLSPIPAMTSNGHGDHELKKNVEWSVLKRNPDRTRSELDDSSGSSGTQTSSEAGEQAGAPIHGLGMGDLGPADNSLDTSPKSQQVQTPSDTDTSDDHTPEPEAFPPVFPCVSHTREQLAELAKLQKSATERRVAQEAQKRREAVGRQGQKQEETPLTPSPSASPSLKVTSMMELGSEIET